MKKTILKMVVCALFVAPALLRGQETNNAMPSPAQPLPPPAVAPAASASTETPATNAPAKPKKMRTTLAITGKASNVDTNAMTLTVGKHTFEITSDTRITKGGLPAILSDISVDDKVGVSYKKDGDKFDALTINDGKKVAKLDSGTNAPAK